MSYSNVAKHHDKETTMTRNKYDIAAAIMSADLDGYEGKLTATQQRTLFGAVIFGKKTVRINCDNQGTVDVLHPCWEGTHTSYSVETRSFDTLCSRA
jgi:hypothetical protein